MLVFTGIESDAFGDELLLLVEFDQCGEVPFGARPQEARDP